MTEREKIILEHRAEVAKVVTDHTQAVFKVLRENPGPLGFAMAYTLSQGLEVKILEMEMRIVQKLAPPANGTEMLVPAKNFDDVLKSFKADRHE